MGAGLFREWISYFTVLQYVFGDFSLIAAFCSFVGWLVLAIKNGARCGSWLGNKLEKGLGEGEAPVARVLVLYLLVVHVAGEDEDED